MITMINNRDKIITEIYKSNVIESKIQIMLFHFKRNLDKTLQEDLKQEIILNLLTNSKLEDYYRDGRIDYLVYLTTYHQFTENSNGGKKFIQKLTEDTNLNKFAIVISNDDNIFKDESTHKVHIPTVDDRDNYYNKLDEMFLNIKNEKLKEDIKLWIECDYKVSWFADRKNISIHKANKIIDEMKKYLKPYLNNRKL